MSRWPGDDGKKPEVYTTDNNEYTEQSLKEHGMKIFVKKNGIEDKQRKGYCCQNTHWTKRNNIVGPNMNKFCYLGNIVTTDAKFNREIKRRLAKGIPKVDRTPEIEKSLIANGKNTAMYCHAVYIRYGL